MPKRHQSQDDRDLEGAQARRERELRARDQVDELAEATDDAVPDDAADGDDTRPMSLLNDHELEMWDRISRHKRYVRERAKDTGDRILEAMGKRPPAERLTALETRLRILWAMLAFLAALALGSIITVAKGLYERGETDGAHEQRLQQVEHASDRNSVRLDRLERDSFDGRRRSTEPDRPALLLPSAQRTSP